MQALYKTLLSWSIDAGKVVTFLAHSSRPNPSWWQNYCLLRSCYGRWWLWTLLILKLRIKSLICYNRLSVHTLFKIQFKGLQKGCKFTRSPLSKIHIIRNIIYDTLVYQYSTKFLLKQLFTYNSYFCNALNISMMSKSASKHHKRHILT